MASEKSQAGWYFLAAVILIQALTYFIDPKTSIESLSFSLSIFEKIIPVFILVFVIMVLTNIYATPDKVGKYLGHSRNIKGWLISIVGGIISTGPIYMWYPMLKDLRKRGMKNGFVAVFLYTRAIKLPLIPMMVFYFGLKFTIILTVVMLFASVLQGIIIEKWR